MTSAVDIIAPKPAARPEPAAKAAPRDDDRSFADALDAEISEPEAAAPTKEVTKEAAPKETVAKEEPATPDTNVAAQPAQPQQPTAAVNSPEAILAGLTQAAPTEAPTIEAGEATPAIDAAPQAAAPTAAAQPAPAATPQPAAPQPIATPQAASPQADAAAPVEATQTAAPAATPVAQPAAPVQTAQAAQAAPVAAPATTAATDEAAPLSAPGNERSAAEATPAATTKSNTTTTNTAADPAATSKAQGVQPKTTQVAANATAEAAPDIKADVPAPTTTTVDALATTRSAAETARATQTHPALQNAPATTIQVYQRMVERFDGRAQRYEVRLDPAELGRVDVRIEVGADKKVHAVLAAHDSAALTDLMRGQRSLERAINDAGFDLAEGGIRFELSSDQGRNPNDNNGNRSSNVWRGFNTLDVAVDAQTAAAGRPWRSSARLDVVA